MRAEGTPAAPYWPDGRPRRSSQKSAQPSGLLGRRVRVQVVVGRIGVMPNSGRRCPIVDDPSVTKDDGAVDEGGQWSKFVQDEKDRGAVGVQPGEGVGQRALVGEIHPGHRLVEDEQIRLSRQGASNEDPLLLTAG